MPLTTGFVNTCEFSPYALGKEVAPPITKKYEYREFWKVDRDRCINGYSVGGVKITGPHYYFLNHKKILRVNNERGGRKELLPPRFTDLGYDFFWAYHNARYVHKKRGMAVTGSRQRGKTYMSATLGDHELTFYPKSQVLVIAHEDAFAADTFKKIKEYLDQNKGTAYFKRRISFNDDMILLGKWVKDLISKEKIRSGFLSECHKLIARNNAQTSIGKVPSLVLREEAGKFLNYTAQLNFMKMQLEAEGQYTGFVLDFGTGGDMTKKGSTGLRDMFWGGETHDYMTFDEDFDDDGNFHTGKGTKIGFYMPAYRGMLMDKEGNSLMKESLEKIKLQRLNDLTDPVQYAITVSQEPITPEESFWIAGSSVLPTLLLNRRLGEIQKNASLRNLIQRGDLEWIRNNRGEPIDVEWIPNPLGKFHIIEHPEWTKPPEQRKVKLTKEDGWNLYISGCDSYDADESTTDSLGSIFVYKRFSNADATGNLFVAQYTGRPNAEDFFEATAKLNWYYKSKMLFEATNLGIRDWYIRNGFTHFLKEKPQVAYTQIKDSHASYTYGLQMPEQIKNYLISSYVKWIKTYVDNMFFADLIQDGINFTRETNHDRTMAAMLCIVNDLDYFRISAEQTEVVADHRMIYTGRSDTGKLTTVYK